MARRRAGPDLGAVRTWTATLLLGGTTRSIPVQAVGRRLALAAVTETATALTLRLRLRSGAPATFVVDLSAA
ncbi:hypothetical protein [Actinoplanes sp. NPDC023714]|uniref:hypothetical protein n=1 Tax=Actinoplanes sp. NPDC023714 TaxID=3154322 RepID=UPI00340A13A3